MSNLPVPSYPAVNGQRTDYTSITFLANGAPIAGITEINYGQELKPGDVYGTPVQKIGSTVGQLKAKADFSILQLEWNLLIPVLATIATGSPASGYMQARFDIQVQYQLPGSAIIITDTLRGCKVSNHDISNKSGPDVLLEKIELDLFYILKNGVAPVAYGPQINNFVAG